MTNRTPAANNNEFVVVQFKDGDMRKLDDEPVYVMPNAMYLADTNQYCTTDQLREKIETKKTKSKSRKKTTQSSTPSYDFDRGEQIMAKSTREESNNSDEGEVVDAVTKSTAQPDDNEENACSCCSRKTCCTVLLTLLGVVIILFGAGLSIYFLGIPKLRAIFATSNTNTTTAAAAVSSAKPSSSTNPTISTNPTSFQRIFSTTYQTLETIQQTTSADTPVTTTTTPHHIKVSLATPKWPTNPHVMDSSFDVNPNDVRPHFYKLFLDLTQFNPSNTQLKKSNVEYTGQLNVTVTIERPGLRSIFINVNQNLVQSRWSHTVLHHIDTDQRISFTSVRSWANRTMLEFPLNDPLVSRDQYELIFPSFTIKTDVHRKQDGGIFYGINGKSFVTWTDFKLRGARSVFPCFDHPQLRATFQLQLQHHSQLNAISSQAIHNHIRGFSTLTTFRLTPEPISTYSLSFSLTSVQPDRRFDSTPYLETKGKAGLILPRSVVPADDPKWILRYSNKMIDQMGQISPVIKKRWPTDVLYFLVPPSNGPKRGGGEDGLGLVILPKSFVQGRRTPNRKRKLAYFVARQCMGHSVTVKEWSQICLQEAFVLLLSKMLYQMQMNVDNTRNAKSLKQVVLYIIKKTRSTALAYRGSVISKKINGRTNLVEKCHSKAPLIFTMLMFHDLMADEYSGGHEDRIQSFMKDVLEYLQSTSSKSIDVINWKRAVKFHYPRNAWTERDRKTLDDVFDSYLGSDVTGYPLISAHTSGNQFNFTQAQELNPLNPDKDTQGFVNGKTTSSSSDTNNGPHLFTANIHLRLFFENATSPVNIPFAMKHAVTTFTVPGNGNIVNYYMVDPNGLTLSRNLYHVQNYQMIYDHCFDDELHRYNKKCHFEKDQIGFLTADFCYGLLRNKFPLSTDPSQTVGSQKENWRNLLMKLAQFSDKNLFPKVCACCLNRAEASTFQKLCVRAKASICPAIKLLNDLEWNNAD